MFGKRYILEFVIRKYSEENKKHVYKIYVTDMLNGILQCAARFTGATYNGKRYFDIIEPADNGPERSSEDIISSISKTLEFLGKEEDKNGECI